MCRRAVGPLPALAALAALAVGFSACGAGASGSRGPERTFPPYTGHATDLFDDAIEPAAVGYELDRGADPMNSALLRERAQVGDAIVRARVTTVTSKDEDRGRTWQIGLHTLERLGGSGPLDADFTVQVTHNGASAGILRAFEGRLIGKTFVAFMREYAREGSLGDSDLHFHFAQDQKDQVGAVHAAVTVERSR